MPCNQCYSDAGENRNPTCPVCQPYLNELAECLPFAHCSQSRLYCHISGLPMNENNQPMMLPNGHIYGEQVRYTGGSGFDSRRITYNNYISGVGRDGASKQRPSNLSQNEGDLRVQESGKSVRHVVICDTSSNTQSVFL